MSSLNKVTLIGNVGQDPEVRSFSNGGQVASLRVATSERWKDKSTGEQKESTEWHTVTVFAEPLVKLCAQYINKGSKLYIEGQLETRKWQDKTGTDKYSTEVVLRPYKGIIKLLNSNNVVQRTDVNDLAHQAPPSRDLDDEIPF